jgi:hypothetical protein
VATWFGITATVTDQTLPVDTRSGQQLYTVTNESGTLIRGDGLIVPTGDTRVEWFGIVQPSRVYSPDGSEQIPVTIQVPETVDPGVYGYRLRMVVGDGIPEEQFNDGPESRITVQPIPLPPPPPPPPPPPKPFPWWIVIAAIVAVVVIGGIIFVVTRPKSQPDLVVSSVNIANGGFEGVTVKVSNTGDTPAGSFVVFLTFDFSFPFSPIALVDTVPGLDAHASTDVNFFPNTNVQGVTGRAIVDTGDSVAESDENNNVFQLP